MKKEGRKISMVTCYDYSSARVVAESNVDSILVGVSLAMVMHGHPTTLTATTAMMAMHTAAVAKGAPAKFIVADLPFLSYRKGLKDAMDSVQELMSAGAHAVKLEGVRGHVCILRNMPPEPALLRRCIRGIGSEPFDVVRTDLAHWTGLDDFRKSDPR